MLNWFYFSFTSKHQYEEEPIATSTPIGVRVTQRKHKGHQPTPRVLSEDGKV